MSDKRMQRGETPPFDRITAVRYRNNLVYSATTDVVVTYNRTEAQPSARQVEFPLKTAVGQTGLAANSSTPTTPHNYDYVDLDHAGTARLQVEQAYEQAFQPVAQQGSLMDQPIILQGPSSAIKGDSHEHSLDA